MPNLGGIGSNTIFCEISLLTVPEAPISATPEDEGLKCLYYLFVCFLDAKVKAFGLKATE